MSEPLTALREAWTKREGPVVLTTTDDAGVPNAIYASCVKQLDDNRIVVADNYFHKTRANIERGSRASVLFMTSDKKAYQIKGSVDYLKSGAIYDDMRQWVDQKHPRVAVAVVQAEELYAGATRLI